MEKSNENLHFVVSFDFSVATPTVSWVAPSHPVPYVCSFSVRLLGHKFFTFAGDLKTDGPASVFSNLGPTIHGQQVKCPKEAIELWKEMRARGLGWWEMRGRLRDFHLQTKVYPYRLGGGGGCLQTPLMFVHACGQRQQVAKS